jgi:hypothetical protein
MRVEDSGQIDSIFELRNIQEVLGAYIRKVLKQGAELIRDRSCGSREYE